MDVVQIQGLTKHFGRVTAVNNLSVSIPKGQVFGILGPNGSGKTTTLAMLAGVVNPSAGSYAWFGEASADDVRKRIGIILERPNFYPYMSAYDNLAIVAQIKGCEKSRIQEVLNTVGLSERMKHKFSTYSLGMKQRLSIASALLANPEVLVLDEPTNGLDPQGIAEIRALILQIHEQGKTIILASHLLDEVQKVCDHFMVLNKGQLMHVGPVNEVSEGTAVVRIAAADMESLTTHAKNCPAVNSIETHDGELKVVLTEGHNIADFHEYLIEKGIVLEHLSQEQKSLEQKFLQILDQA